MLLAISGNRPYIPAAGSLQPRENLHRLIDAYRAVRLQGSLHARLRIVGRSRYRAHTIRQYAAPGRFADDIIFTDYVPDRTLNALYRNCSASVYPSLYEGFGLPVLEAMSLGVPVITSTTSSLPEVAGDAALLVDPTDTAALTAAIIQLAEDRDLRAQLIARGRQRTSAYHWSSVAAATIAGYPRVVAAR